MRFAFVAAAVLIALGAGPAVAAPGKLTPRGCIEDTGGSEGCAREAAALGGAGGIAISPDGRSIYVTAFDEDAIVQLNRNKRTGVLRAAGCIDDEPPGGPDTCPRSEPGLDGAADVVVSPDGRHVYTVGYHDSTLLHFKRNRRTGRLQAADCIDDADEAPVDDACPGGAEGMQGSLDMAISADGRSLYVAAQLDEAVIAFRLNRRGKPIYRGCFEDDDKFLADDCPGNREGLSDASGVAISPDGDSVYVAGPSDSAIARFKRRPDSRLSYRDCVDNRDPAGPDDCERLADGIREVRSLGISPDGRFLYSGVSNDGSMGRFRINRQGILRPQSCVESPFSSADCATTALGLGRTNDFAFDSRGRSLYVAGGNPIQPFDRVPASGLLTEQPCIEDKDRPPLATSCSRKAPGLNGAAAFAISPDDRWLYAASAGDDAVAIFKRSR